MYGFESILSLIILIIALGAFLWMLYDDWPL